jgi:hypothetical protein
MVRRKPFTQEHIAEREKWPEIQAGLRGPESYDELGILSAKQRGELVRLARVESEREKTFIEEVTCNIISYRRRMRVAHQESPAAVAESMRRLIDRVYVYSCDVWEYPLIVTRELKPPLPAADWFERANEKLREKEQWLKGHRPQRLTELLIMHAWVLQKLAGAYSKHLASNWEAMMRWLGVALIASGQVPPGKNAKTAYFEQLMLPRAADGSVDLTGRPPALDTLKANN